MSGVRCGHLMWLAWNSKTKGLPFQGRCLQCLPNPLPGPDASGCFLHLSPLPCFADASCIRMKHIKDIALVMLLRMRIGFIQDYTRTSLTLDFSGFRNSFMFTPHWWSFWDLLPYGVREFETSHQNLLDIPRQSVSGSAKLAPWMQDGHPKVQQFIIILFAGKPPQFENIPARNYHTTTAINWGVTSSPFTWPRECSWIARASVLRCLLLGAVRIGTSTSCAHLCHEFSPSSLHWSSFKLPQQLDTLHAVYSHWLLYCDRGIHVTTIQFSCFLNCSVRKVC